LIYSDLKGSGYAFCSTNPALKSFFSGRIIKIIDYFLGNLPYFSYLCSRIYISWEEIAVFPQQFFSIINLPILADKSACTHS